MAYRALIFLLLHLELIQTYNNTLYLLQKIPWLGGFIKDSLYDSKVKQAASIVQILVACFRRLVKLLLYLGGLLITTVIWSSLQGKLLRELSWPADLANSSQNLIKGLAIAFSLFMSSFMNIELIRVDFMERRQLLALKVFHIQTRPYYLVTEVLELLSQFLTLGLGLGLIFAFSGWPSLEAICFASLTLGCRICLKVLALKLYRPQHHSPNRYHTILAFTGVAIGLAYLAGLFCLGEKLSSQWAFGWPAGLLGTVLLGFGLWYLSVAKNLDFLARRLVTFSALSSSNKQFSEANQIGLSFKERNLAVTTSIALGKRGGAAYLNQVFLRRLGGALKKRVGFRLLVILLVTGLIQLMLFLNTSLLDKIQKELPFASLLILSSLLGNIAYLGEYYIKYYFFNLDRHFLKFNYYRQPSFVLATLKVRLQTSLIYNIPIFLALVLSCVSLSAVIYGFKFEYFLLILLCQLIALLFFSLHFLYLYFLLQPFTVEMRSRSYLYTIISSGTYLLFWFLLTNFRRLTLSFLGLMGLASLLYIIFGAWLVLTWVPKTFKLR